MIESNSIIFGDPDLRGVSLVRKYELNGVAFVKEYEKTVGFTFYSQCKDDLRLEMEDMYQAHWVYAFFKDVFKESFSNQPSMTKAGMMGLYAEFKLKAESRESLLTNINRTMGVHWQNAFSAIFSAHDT
jgi:hypothetical protein